MRIKNFFFKRIVIDDDEFPYLEEQSNFQVIENDLLIIETDENSYFFVTLDNSTIEYSLQISNFKNNNHFVINPDLGIKKNSAINDFFNQQIVEILYLHKIGGNEIVSKFNINKSELIGIKFFLSNGFELFIYSGEPIINNEGEIVITREGSVICMVFNNKSLIPIDNIEFTHKYGNVVGNG